MDDAVFIICGELDDEFLFICWICTLFFIIFTLLLVRLDILVGFILYGRMGFLRLLKFEDLDLSFILEVVLNSGELEL